MLPWNLTVVGWSLGWQPGKRRAWEKKEDVGKFITALSDKVWKSEILLSKVCFALSWLLLNDLWVWAFFLLENEKIKWQKIMIWYWDTYILRPKNRSKYVLQVFVLVHTIFSTIFMSKQLRNIVFTNFIAVMQKLKCSRLFVSLRLHRSIHTN